MGNKRLNDATPAEWDAASAKIRGTVSVTSADPSNSLSIDDLIEYDTYDFSALQKFAEPSVAYKFREDELIEEFKQYIDSTYSAHYGQGGLQSFEVIVDRGHGMGFTSGNIDKYNGRYGNKGDTPADWRKDIMKTIHYGLLKLYEHDRIHGK